MFLHGSVHDSPFLLHSFWHLVIGARVLKTKIFLKIQRSKSEHCTPILTGQSVFNGVAKLQNYLTRRGGKKIRMENQGAETVILMMYEPANAQKVKSQQQNNFKSHCKVLHGLRLFLEMKRKTVVQGFRQALPCI